MLFCWIGAWRTALRAACLLHLVQLLSGAPGAQPCAAWLMLHPAPHILSRLLAAWYNSREPAHSGAPMELCHQASHPPGVMLEAVLLRALTYCPAAFCCSQLL